MAVELMNRPTRLRTFLGARRGGGRGDRGTVTPMMLIMAGGILILIGVCYDGGTYYSDQQHADFIAQEAARAGAQDIDVNAYLATGQASLNRDAATQDVINYLRNVKDLTIVDRDAPGIYFGPNYTSIQVTIQVSRTGVFLTDKSWHLDTVYGNAVVVLQQGVTSAGG
jgi:hypothetical protein